MFQHGTRLATEKRFHRPPVHVPFAMVLDEDMSERIGAIETEYSGIKFRSRLEARWAVFFDRCGLEWRYEVEGFQAGGYKYLPDFYLPRPKTWCEVKGDPDGVAIDADKILAVMSSGALPGGELLLLSDIPRGAGASHILMAHPMLIATTDGGPIERQWGVFCEVAAGDEVNLYGLGPDTSLATLLGVEVVNDLKADSKPKHWSAKTKTVTTPFAWGHRVIEAYAAAASARFEHGQKGAI